MKLINKLLFSTRAMSMMLLIYAIALAIATFVENDFGTPAAKEMIYYAIWFNVLQTLLIVNFVINIKRYRLWRREKWSLLLFHLAFPVMFIGAAITHLVSVEGVMNIREGETSNEIISSQTFVKMSLFDQDMALAYETPYQMTYFNQKKSPFPLKRTFESKYQFKDRVISLRSLDYIPLAKDTIIRGEGTDMLEIVTMGEGGRKSTFIQNGEMKQAGGLMFSLNSPIPGTVQITNTPSGLVLKSPFEGTSINMQGQAMGQITDSVKLAQSQKNIKIDEVQPLEQRALYTLENTTFIIPRPVFKGKVEYVAGDKTNKNDQMNTNVIIMEYDDGIAKDTLIVKGAQGDTNFSSRKSINGLQVSLGYGSNIIKTPFGMKLNDFQLDRYPGSDNPSSFASEIAVVDEGKETEHRIYMNNVLDYKGYRFFQSGYDPDELGTRLSVNQDRLGTNVTYLGYFMLFTGMFLSLFWRGTRFWDLQKQLKNIKKRAVSVVLILGLMSSYAQTSNQAQHNHSEEEAHFHSTPSNQELVKMVSADEIIKEINFDADHIYRLEHLLVQDDQGRIKPLGTHALELLRKIYKSDHFHGINATEWFVSLQQNPSLWATAPLIFVSSQKLGKKDLEKLGADESGHTSLLNMVDPKTTQYKLQKDYNDAFRKKPADRTLYDQEVLNITERFTIMDNIAKGFYLRLIPRQNEMNETWTSWIIPSDPIELDSTALRFISGYFNAIGKAQKDGNWQLATQKVDEIENYQRKWGKNVVPSKKKVDIEIIDNHINPFLWLLKIYGTLGLILLVFSFMTLFLNKNKWVRRGLNLSLGLTIAALVFHFAALGLRWYITGHAPWTSGYEAVVFISWVGVFAGFLMYRNGNAFLPTAGVFVAVIMMGFAHGSSLLDPEITPLVPVLKSYWLIIHVAIIVSSYGFFGLGMVISIFALILYLLPSSPKIQKTIKELTIVNEMSLTVGIYTLAVGTFLGGMWANESWGRYWSWDPKETWAFISIIVYAFVLHMRLVPGLRGNFAFNVASLWAIAAPIMTYIGVNYYLSGLHTYAAGDAIPIPTWIPVITVLFLVLTIAAYLRKRRS